MRVYSKPTAPRSIGGVLGDGLRLGWAGFSKTWPLALFAQILVALPIIFFKARFGDADLGSVQANMMALQSPTYSLIYLALALLSAGFQNAITAQNASVAQSLPSTMGDSLAIGFRLLPRAVLLGILLLLGFLLIGICFMIPAIFVGIGARTLLMVLFLVPLFYYLGRFILANVIFVAEDVAAYASLLRSWLLTKDHYWRTSAILSVLLIMFVAVLLAVGLLTGVIGAVLGAKGTLSLSLVQGISALANMLFTPFISAVLLAVYYDLKLRQDGEGLGETRGLVA
jgi:hypothetical protein